ncbi:hypothetical protein VTL71DRAFT_50 [Oculimacula yallundae]|uniref:Uncharacterized protein n=1 Tax=Oculimacula yallundae TaxID=86028 RepID=A0ABR4CYV5_9HELO
MMICLGKEKDSILGMRIYRRIKETDRTYCSKNAQKRTKANESEAGRIEWHGRVCCGGCRRWCIFLPDLFSAYTCISRGVYRWWALF